MTAFLRELRLAARALRRAPAFALVAVAVVAVGVGANVLVFSLANALLLRPLPVPDADELVRVGRSTRGARFGTVSYPEYRELRDAGAAGASLDLIAHHPNSAILTAGGEPRPTW
ncbi:MAG TPA: hypothetical protein VKA84_24785, partial [Gemmatimonadaceae bacterium]|nr:hypothetical protein [Gemmatimonadaceae bacterium]